MNERLSEVSRLLRSPPEKPLRW